MDQLASESSSFHRVEPHTLEQLKRSLIDEIDGEVRFDDGSRALYASDGSNYRQIPIGVVVPRHHDDIARAFKVAAKHGIPILSRGGGTSLSGQCVNTALVLDYSKFVHGVEELDVENRVATVLPGTNLDALRVRAEEHGLTFGPDPSTHTHCTLGGMLGNNSCGVHAVLSEFYGPGARTEDNIVELEVLTYDGCRVTVGATPEDEIERIVEQGGRRGKIYERLRDLRNRYAKRIRDVFPDLPRRVSGFNLPALLPENGFHVAKALVGSEGTCVAVLKARVRLVPHKKDRVLCVLGYRSVFEAGDDIMLVRRFKPIGCEGLDRQLVEYMRTKHLHEKDLDYLPDGEGWLLVEFGDDHREAAKAQASAFAQAMKTQGHCQSIRIYDCPKAQSHLWEIREAGLGATAYVPGKPDTWPGWEDAAVPPERVGSYLRKFSGLLKSYGYDASLYGHFAQGCIHCRINFDLTSEGGLAVYRDFSRAAADLVVSMGGSISGEHGDGQARGELLPRMYGEELMEAFREFKAIWDPRGKMNPGKVIDAASRTSHLRLGTDYAPWEPETSFRFESDGGRFAHATLRCVGVGKCRRDEGGTMCPSFMATQEEKHSTRGRAHLLFEMVRGDFLEGRWREEAVKESLDLCLSCKGCTSDCPVSVDIPTYKAEFFSHFFKNRLRPREQYAFGLIHRWAPFGSLAPWLSNWMTQANGVSTIAKWLANMAPERKIPELSRQTFRRWFSRRKTPNPHGRQVLLWPDTFNNHFHPRTLIAATCVLEHLGYRVTIPQKRLCCGRALYDHGLLKEAESLWEEVLDALQQEIADEVPIIGVEPSCVAAFRDELRNLMGAHEQAKKLQGKVLTLSEFLLQDPEFSPPRLGERILWQPHCHQKAVGTRASDAELFSAMGLEVLQPNDSCCGMAGAFGFEKKKYPLSQAIGERKLFPALRREAGKIRVVADGFSCREQIVQASGELPTHTAELLAHGMGILRRPQDVDSAAHPRKRVASSKHSLALQALLVATLLFLSTIGWW